MDFNNLGGKRLMPFFLAWFIAIFAVTLLIPALLHHSAGYENVYTRSVEALRTSFTFGPDLYIAPGMPLLLYFASFFGEVPWVDVVRLVQFVLYGALVALTYHAGRLLFQKEIVGVVGAGITAVSPMLLIQLFSFGPDLLYATALLTGIVFLLRMIRGEGRSTLNAAVAGIALGFAALTDPIGLYVIPIAGLWAAVFSIKKRQKIFHGVVLFFVFTIAASAIIAPWYARNAVVFGIKEAPVVQKIIESQVLTNPRTVALVTYPFLHKPSAVLKRMSEIFLLPPDLDLFDQNTSISYRKVAADLIFHKVVPNPGIFAVLFLKGFITVAHGALMVLAAIGFFLVVRKPIMWLFPFLAVYVSFAVIGYGSLSSFDIAPLNEFLIPLYGPIYVFAGYALIRTAALFGRYNKKTISWSE